MIKELALILGIMLVGNHALALKSSVKLNSPVQIKFNIEDLSAVISSVLSTETVDELVNFLPFEVEVIGKDPDELLSVPDIVIVPNEHTQRTGIVDVYDRDNSQRIGGGRFSKNLFGMNILKLDFDLLEEDKKVADVVIKTTFLLRDRLKIEGSIASVDYSTSMSFKLKFDAKDMLRKLGISD